jgi:hypothetical protein
LWNNVLFFKEGDAFYVLTVIDDRVKKVAVTVKERRDTTAALIFGEAI